MPFSPSGRRCREATDEGSSGETQTFCLDTPTGRSPQLPFGHLLPGGEKKIPVLSQGLAPQTNFKYALFLSIRILI